MTTRAELIDWLRDVYALEKAKETALTKLTVHPHHAALRKQASLHCTETRRHAESIANCLKQLGSDASSLNTLPAQGMEDDIMRSAGIPFVQDERIKDALTVLVTEHFEIACHNILRAGAEQLGLQDIVRISDQILFEEKRMVQWLQVNLPTILSSYVGPPAVTKEEDAEVEYGLDPAGNGTAGGLVHWQFVQLKPNMPQLATPRARFAPMLN